MTVSVIIPVYNEEAVIEGLLRSLAVENPREVLVADGGSTDQTVEYASRHARVLACPRGRAVQLNHAASIATGEVLLFLHADVRLAPGAIKAISEALADKTAIGGNFDIEYEGGDRTAGFFTWMNRKRCRFGVFYGDSGIFCRRSIFDEMGGFSKIPILEDYEFARRLWKRGGVKFVDHRITVSARRWRKAGVWWTMWGWFWIQALYLAGASPDRLARFYRNVR